MDCRAVRERYSAVMEGDLGAPEEREVRAHLAACEACDRDFRAFAEVVPLLPLGAEEDDLPADFTAQVLARLPVAGRVGPGRAAPRRPRPYLPWAVAAASLLYAASLHLGWDRARPSDEAGPSPAPPAATVAATVPVPVVAAGASRPVPPVQVQEPVPVAVRPEVEVPEAAPVVAAAPVVPLSPGPGPSGAGVEPVDGRWPSQPAVATLAPERARRFEIPFLLDYEREGRRTGIDLADVVLSYRSERKDPGRTYEVSLLRGLLGWRRGPEGRRLRFLWFFGMGS